MHCIQTASDKMGVITLHELYSIFTSSLPFDALKIQVFHFSTTVKNEIFLCEKLTSSQTSLRQF